MSISAYGQTNSSHVYVQPYTRSNGTQVQGHYRTAPNSTNRDNFSTIPNSNPYTGKQGNILPDNNPLDISNGNRNYTQPLPANTLNYTEGNININNDNINSLTKQLFSGTNYDSYPSYELINNGNLRAEMSSNSAIKSRLSKGTIVKVTNSFFGDWWEVYCNGETGYIRNSSLQFVSEGYSSNSNLLLLNSNPTISTLNIDPIISTLNIDPSHPIYYTKRQVNLRAEMSTNSAILIKIPEGSSVEVTSSFFGDWWEVRYCGRSGYVVSSLLTK